MEQCVVWQRLSEQLGWQCDNVRASYNEISQAVQNEVYAGAKAFVKANKGRYECGGYIYTGEGQDIGQFWAKLNVGNAKVKKTSSNPTVTDGNATIPLRVRHLVSILIRAVTASLPHLLPMETAIPKKLR